MARRIRTFEERSEAARKGWETRRLSERMKEQGRVFESQAERYAYIRRALAARKGWETRREREREQREGWPPDPYGVWVVEEPIDEVGGRFYD